MGNWHANFNGKFFPQSFQPCFSRVLGALPKKLTPRIHDLNCGCSSNSQIFENKSFHADFLLTGRPKEGSFHDGLGGCDGFGGSREHLVVLLLVLQIQDEEGKEVGIGPLSITSAFCVISLRFFC